VYKDNVVLIPDNEPRNLEIVKQIEKYINENFQVVIWPSDIKQKDINEMILSGKTERNIKDIIAQNTFSGLLARTKLIEWKKV
jgi:exopolyphosphatase/pppGpp-phosphohydrolase